MTEDRTMNINAIGLQIREMGPPDGHAIALVAGWPQTLHAWRLVQPKLASQGFRVIAIDPPGIGGSDMLPDGSLADTGTVAEFMTASIAVQAA